MVVCKIHTLCHTTRLRYVSCYSLRLTISARPKNFRAHKNFFLNRSVINTYEIFSGHIGDGYREIQETGTHRWDLQTLPGRPDLERLYVLGLQIIYLFDVILDLDNLDKVSNQVTQRDPTDSSQDLWVY